ncbi:uridine kinase family protein [Tessaracoccus flavescens]|uniref:uridine kinase family protein n=1 Tax=Tessaracoccus flavescens TaxID=399497 RepID=UPI0009875808|nr:uridine kinase [Tessaracoccus flavescens]
MSRSLLLIAGPSGSGKSRLTRLAAEAASALPLSLDDFYHDADHPDLPMTPMGIPDWDRVETWDLEAALLAISTLLSTGRCEVPEYDISLSRRVGSKVVELGDARIVVAEGIFAIDALQPAIDAGIEAEGWWLDRRRAANFSRRLARDLREKRKTPPVLLRRGAALYRAEPALRREAMRQGFRPTSMRAALATLAG